MPPIYNFDILNIEGKYCQKFSQIFTLDKNSWSQQFNDWDQMELKFGVECDTDFYLLTHQNWLRLLSLYGGGPEIPIYQYFEQQSAPGFGTEQQTEKIARYDFDPIKVTVHVMGKMRNSYIFEHEHTLLLSRNVNQQLMKQAFIEARQDIGQNNFKMFVVKPNESMPQSDTRHPLISEIPKERRSLYSLGIKDRSNVVFVTLEEADEQLDTNALMDIYKKIENEFELYSRDNDVEVLNTNFLNDINDVNDLDNPIYQSPPRSKQKPINEFGMGYEYQNIPTNNNKGDVPAEYADDPDMYYAIQASLGNQISGQIKDNDSDPLEPTDDGDFYLNRNNAKKTGSGSTGPNSDGSLDYANVSMTDNTLP